MTKRDLVDKLTLKAGSFSREDLSTIVETVFGSMAESLAREEKIEIRRFGSFKVKQREGRKGRNPRSGEAIYIEPKKVPFFKASKELKERVDR